MNAPEIRGWEGLMADAAGSRLYVQIVENLQTPDERAPVQVSFTRLAAIYFLSRESPHFCEWLRILTLSLEKKLPVAFTYHVDGQLLTSVELANE